MPWVLTHICEELNKVVYQDLKSLLNAEHPVAFHHNGFGDRLLVLPALRALSSLFSNRLKLICGIGDHSTYYSDLSLSGVYEIEYRISKEGRLFNASDVANAVGACDLFISFNTWFSESLDDLLRLLRPANSIGFFPEFTHPISINRKNHMVDRMFDIPYLLKPSLCLDNFSKPVQLPCKDVERARLLRAKVPQPVHVMAIHTETVPEKMWPTDRFISLLDKFFENHPNYVAFVVDKADRALDAGEHSNHVIPLPFQPLATAFALVGESDLFLGVDSCMLHAADLFRVPGVGLFGPTDYRVFGFRFGPHQHVYSNGCMEDINEEDVLDALEHIVVWTSTNRCHKSLCLAEL
jgi:hypothetical protein